MISSMARKHYTDEFRRQAVAWERAAPGRAERAAADAALAEQIKTGQKQDKAYGAPGSPPSSTTAPRPRTG